MKRLAFSLAVAVGLAAGLVAPGCTGEPGPWVRPRRQARAADAATGEVASAEALRVEYGGCATVWLAAGDQLECVYQPGATLRLWIVHEAGQSPAFAVEGDGAWSMGEPYELPEELGQGYRIELTEPGLEAVTVSLPGRPRWRLSLRAVEALSKAERKALEELRERFEGLEKKLADSDLSVLPEAREMVSGMVERGWLWSAIRSGTAAAYQLTWRVGRPALAQELLVELRAELEQRLHGFAGAFPHGNAVISIFLGHTLRRRGQLVEAAHEYRQATRLVRRTQSPLEVLDAMAPYALVLAELGYFEAASHWSAEVQDVAFEHATPYNLAQILTMVARVSLRLREARQDYDDPTPRLEEVKRIYGPEGPLAGKYYEPFDALLSRAELALLEGRPRDALAELEDYRKGPHTADRRARTEELRLRALIRMGASAWSLRRTLTRVQALAVEAVGPEFRWRSAVLAARVYGVLGERARSLDAYLEAEALLDRLLPLAALGIPGDFTAAQHSESTARLVALLAEQGDLRRAVCTIRRSRARVSQLALFHRRLDEKTRAALSVPIEQYSLALHAYEELLENSTLLAVPAYERARSTAAQRQQDLETRAFEILSAKGTYQVSLACEDLTPREPGELLLLLFPEGSDLHVFVEDDLGVERYPSLRGYFDDEPSQEAGHGEFLLGPLRERLVRADRIRVLASGRANAIPVHALPWAADALAPEREPLAMSVPVVYGLEFPRDPGSEGDEGASSTLILVDGRADRARYEAAEVASKLRMLGRDVTEIVAQDQTPASLRAALKDVDHVHYAGHAYYGRLEPGKRDEDRSRRWPPYSGGAASEPSYIPLGRHGKLTVADVLMMERAPRTVVLMGCATGVVDERMAYGGFSLATAFLGAGSRAVIASTDEIEGEGAAVLGRALYVGAAFGQDPGRWLTDALRHIRAHEQVIPDVTNYRVYVR